MHEIRSYLDATGAGSRIDERVEYPFEVAELFLTAAAFPSITSGLEGFGMNV